MVLTKREINIPSTMVYRDKNIITTMLGRAKAKRDAREWFLARELFMGFLRSMGAAIAGSKARVVYSRGQNKFFLSLTIVRAADGKGNMKLFFTDLDNTLIYSYKNTQVPREVPVECYEGREISFMTRSSHKMLQELSRQIPIIPLTTRTKEQYERLDLGISFPQALVCNGGILLSHGKVEEDWRLESRKLVEQARGELQAALSFLEKDPRRSFECRLIEELFIFTKCKEPKAVAEELQGRLDANLAEVRCQGEKLYVLPLALSKGQALLRMKRLWEQRGQEVFCLAAGDSAFDASMLLAAHQGFGREGMGMEARERIQIIGEERVFSEEILKNLKKLCG